MLPNTYAKGNRKTIENLLQARQQAQTDKAPRVAMRIQAVLLSLQQRSVPEIAELLQVHRSTVHSWIVSWNQYKLEGLLEGHRSGRQCRLSSAEVQKLHDIVESGPVAYGLECGIWTSPLVSQIIKDEFDVEYHPGHVRKILQQIGFSVQRPTTKLVQADPQEQRHWVRYRYPNLKKKPMRKKR